MKDYNGHELTVGDDVLYVRSDKRYGVTMFSGIQGQILEIKNNQAKVVWNHEQVPDICRTFELVHANSYKYKYPEEFI